MERGPERMTTVDVETATPKALINIRPVTAIIKSFLVVANYHNLWIANPLRAY